MMTRMHTGACLSLLVATVLVGCGGGGGGTDDFAAIEEVTLQAEPTTLTFSSAGIGETGSQIITIINKSNVPATLTFRLNEDTTDEDQLAEFAWDETQGRLLDGEVVLEGNATLPVIVTYTPQDRFRDTGNVTVSYNNNQSLTIPLDTNEVAPDIDGPSRVIFGRVPAGGRAQKIISIQNVGRAQLDINDIFLANASDEFAFCFPEGAGEGSICLDPEEPGAYPPSLDYLETINIQILYTPTNDGEDSGELKIQSNDPDERPFNITLNANGEEPCILVDGEGGLDFGLGFIGGVSQRTITIENCSPNKDLVIDSILLTEDSDAEFFINDGDLPGDLPGEPHVVPVDTTANFVLSYAPDAEEGNEATIQIISNDSAKSPLQIPVTGLGSTNECPTAVAKAKEAGTAQPLTDTIETIPLTTIQFDASESSDPDNSGAQNGGIAAYEWVIINQPPDSTTRFIPNAATRNPQLFLDLAGTYEIELRVFDEQNTASCETSRVVILATPDEDIHVQLVWDTPGDPDQTDTGTGLGADMDLHFLHPAGNWNEPPWDCFWRNIEPDWATVSDGSDNPSLDIDDTDGAGPENTNLNNPENVTYRVGVYYFSDHNFGPSYATVRIFLSQVLVFEYPDKYMERTGEFWDVATIDWGDAPRVNQIDQTYDGFP